MTSLRSLMVLCQFTQPVRGLRYQKFSLWNPFSNVHSSGAPACRCPVNKRPNCKKSFAVNAKMWPKALSLKITVEFTTRHQPKADMTTALCDFVSPVRLFSFLPPLFFFDDVFITSLFSLLLTRINISSLWEGI